jgi:hypothetical protein
MDFALHGGSFAGFVFWDLFVQDRRGPVWLALFNPIWTFVYSEIPCPDELSPPATTSPGLRVVG